MSLEVWKIIGNAFATIAGAIILAWAIFKIFKEYMAAEVLKVESKHRMQVELEKEKTKGMKEFADLRKDIEELEADIRGLKDDMFEEKKDLLNRLEGLKQHFDKMTQNYFAILAKS